MHKFVELTSHVPTSCLVEDYQSLIRAIQDNDWDMVQTVAECIAGAVDNFTSIPDDVHIEPSVSSLIAMDCKNGLVVDEDGYDYPCACGMPVSKVLAGGVCQCPESCTYKNDYSCDPEEGEIMLKGGNVFQFGESDSSKMLRHLKNQEGV